MDPPTPGGPVPWAAVILAGGTSRRWGGVDKTARLLAGEPVLLRAASAVLPEAAALAVVAPPDHPARAQVTDLADAAGRRLHWTREDPPGGGPVAGLAAGLATPLPAWPRLVAVLAGDLPFTRTAWPRLVAALSLDPAADAALGVDPDGRRQPLLAVYREAALRARLDAAGGRDRSLRQVTEGLVILQVPVSRIEALDLDTPQDAIAAERHAGHG